MSAPETNCTCYSPFSASDDHWRRCPARLELSETEAAIVAHFEAGEPAPESYRLSSLAAAFPLFATDRVSVEDESEAAEDAAYLARSERAIHLWAELLNLDNDAAVERLAEALHEAAGERCPSYSHGEDGWHCAAEGPHDEHRNAAGDATW